jgi:hypothetical protein
MPTRETLPVHSTPNGKSEWKSETSLPKKIWYGVGKVVEPFSARAWNERIIRGVEKLFPHLSKDQQRWIADHHVVIEKAATVAGIGIQSAELYVAFMLAYYSTGKLSKKVRQIQLHRQIRKKYSKFRPYENKINIPFAMDWRSMQGLSAAVIPALAAFAKKYGTGRGYKRYGKTLYALMDALSDPSAGGHLRELKKIYDSGRSPVRKPRARELEPLFLHAFNDVAQRDGWLAVTPRQRLLKDAEGKRLFKLWKNVQFAGLPELFQIALWDPVDRERTHTAASMLAGAPKDFWLLSEAEMLPIEYFTATPRPEFIPIIQEATREFFRKRRQRLGKIHTIAASTADRIQQASNNVQEVRFKKIRKRLDALRASV